jgi:hypothetical protein
MRRLLLLFPVVAVVASASPNADYTGYVTNQITNLVISGVPILLPIGNQLLTWIGVTMLVIYALRWMAHSASRHHPEFPFGELMHFFGLFLVAEMLLRYYDVPLGIVGGISVHQALPKLAQDLAGRISIASLGTVLSRILAIVSGAQTPSYWNPLHVLVYLGILIDMGIIEAVLFALTILGFIAVGIGSVLGPIFIPFLVVNRLNWLFWNWFSFMLQYSFYQVIANCLVFVWTNVLVTFIDSEIAGDYTIAHFIVLIPALVILNAGMFFTVFKITHFVSDLFKGTASAGSGFSSAIGAAVKGAFA